MSDDEIDNIAYSDDDDSDNEVSSSSDIFSDRSEEESDDEDVDEDKKDSELIDDVIPMELDPTDTVVDDTSTESLKHIIPDRTSEEIKHIGDVIYETANQMLCNNEAAIALSSYDAFVQDLSSILKHIKAHFRTKPGDDADDGVPYSIELTGRHVLLPPTTMHINGKDEPLNPVDVLGHGTYSASLMVEIRLVERITGKHICVLPSSVQSAIVRDKASIKHSTASHSGIEHLHYIGNIPIPIGCRLSHNFPLPPDMRYGAFIVSGYPLSMNIQEKMGFNTMIMVEKNCIETRHKSYSNCATHITSVLAIPILEKFPVRSGTMDSITRLQAVVGHRYHCTFFNTMMCKDPTKKKMPVSLNIIHGFRILLSMMLEHAHKVRKILKTKRQLFVLPQLSFLKSMSSDIGFTDDRTYDLFNTKERTTISNEDESSTSSKWCTYVRTYTVARIVVHHIMPVVCMNMSASSSDKRLSTIRLALTKTIETALKETDETNNDDLSDDTRAKSTETLIKLIRAMFVPYALRRDTDVKRTNKFRLIEFPEDDYEFIRYVVTNEFVTHVSSDVTSTFLPNDHIFADKVNAMSPSEKTELWNHVHNANMYYRRALELGRLLYISIDSIGTKGSDKDNLKNKTYEALYSLNRSLIVEATSDMLRNVISVVSKEPANIAMSTLATKISKTIVSKNLTVFIIKDIKSGRWGQKNIHTKEAAITELIKVGESRMAALQSMGKISIPTGGSGTMEGARSIHYSQSTSVSSVTPDGNHAGLRKFTTPLTVVTVYVDPSDIRDFLSREGLVAVRDSIHKITVTINADIYGYIRPSTAVAARKFKNTTRYRQMGYVYSIGTSSLNIYTTEGRIITPYYTIRQTTTLDGFITFDLLLDTETDIRKLCPTTKHTGMIRPSSVMQSLANINPFAINRFSAMRASSAYSFPSDIDYSLTRDQLYDAPSVEELFNGGIIEYLDYNEINDVEFLNIVTDVREFYEKKRSGSYMLISPNFTEALTTACLPNTDHSHGPRINYASLHMRQRNGQTYISDIDIRRDKDITMLMYPQADLCRTRTADAINLNDTYPTTQTCIMGIMSHTCYDIEDACTINRGSVDRGFLRTFIKGTITVPANTLSMASMPTTLTKIQKRDMRKLAIRTDTMNPDNCSYSGIVASNIATDTVGSVNSDERDNAYIFRQYVVLHLKCRDLEAQISEYNVQMNKINRRKHVHRAHDIDDMIVKLNEELVIAIKECNSFFSRICWNDSENVSMLGTRHNEMRDISLMTNKVKVNEGDVIAVDIQHGNIVGSTKMSDYNDAYIQRVERTQHMSSNDKMVTYIVFSTAHMPEIGDKISTQQAQKMTIGLLEPENNMPFTGSGVRLDAMMNPTGFPTRNTVSQPIDMMLGMNACAIQRRVCTLIRENIDFYVYMTDECTERVPFSTLSKKHRIKFTTNNIDRPVALSEIVSDVDRNMLRDRELKIYNMLYVDFGRRHNSGDDIIDDIVAMSDKLGISSTCTEDLYNGNTGEPIDSDIVSGIVNITVLKQLAQKKFNVRDRGAKDIVTMQATHGRKKQGGIRQGDMERITFIAHGLVATIYGRLCRYSDEIIVTICRTCNRICGVQSRLCKLCRHTGNTAELHACKMPFALVMLSYFMNAVGCDLLIKTELIQRPHDRAHFDRETIDMDDVARFIVDHNMRVEMPDGDYMSMLTDILSQEPSNFGIDLDTVNNTVPTVIPNGEITTVTGIDFRSDDPEY